MLSKAGGGQADITVLPLWVPLPRISKQPSQRLQSTPLDYPKQSKLLDCLMPGLFCFACISVSKISGELSSPRLQVELVMSELLCI